MTNSIRGPFKTLNRKHLISISPRIFIACIQNVFDVTCFILKDGGLVLRFHAIATIIFRLNLVQYPHLIPTQVIIVIIDSAILTVLSTNQIFIVMGILNE